MFRKLFFFFFATSTIFISRVASAQSIDFENKKGAKIIRPTLNNLIRLSSVPYSSFQDILNQFGYTRESKGNFAPNEGGTGYYIVNRDGNEVTMLWTRDNEFASSLRNEISSAYSGTVQTFDIYRVNIKGKQYTVKIKIDGANGMVAFE